MPHLAALLWEERILGRLLVVGPRRCCLAVFEDVRRRVFREEAQELRRQRLRERDALAAVGGARDSWCCDGEGAHDVFFGADRPASGFLVGSMMCGWRDGRVAV